MICGWKPCHFRSGRPAETLNIYVDRGGMSSILAFDVDVRQRIADLKAELVRWGPFPVKSLPSLRFRLVSEHLGPLPDHNTFQECGLADKSMLRLVYTIDSIDASSDEEEEGVAAFQPALRRERSRSPHVCETGGVARESFALKHSNNNPHVADSQEGESLSSEKC